MAKTIEEFREDLKLLKQDLYQNAETMDIRMLASFLDRLIASLDEITDRLEATEISVEELSEAEECVCQSAPKKKPKAAAKKKAKPAKKKRR
jgi:hypothetical protein